MAHRVPVVGGNWKMNMLRGSSRELAEAVAVGRKALGGSCEVLVFPPFPFLTEVAEGLSGTSVRLGAQDVFYETEGAYTGEISPKMLRDLGVTDVLVGHSERRHVIGENDILINRKLRAALDSGLNVTFCIGETLEHREAGKTKSVNLGQIRAGLNGVDPEGMSRVIIAYEPVWAIGTGRTATPEDAQSVHRVIRDELASLYSAAIADATRIQYGGSVKPNNAETLFGQPDIDGGLIGGASLKHTDFLDIVKAAVDAGSLVSKKA